MNSLPPDTGVGTERVATLPDVPTCREAGHDVVWQVWLGTFVHKDTPADRVTRLREGFEDLLKDEGLLRLVGRINSEISYLGGDAWARDLEEAQRRLLAIYEKTR